MRKPDIANFTVDKKRDARLNWLWTMGGKIYTRNQRNLWMKTQSNFYEYNHSVRFNLPGKDSTVTRDFQKIFFNMIQPSVILAYFPLNYSLEIHIKYFFRLARQAKANFGSIVKTNLAIAWLLLFYCQVECTYIYCIESYYKLLLKLQTLLYNLFFFCEVKKKQNLIANIYQTF